MQNCVSVVLAAVAHCANAVKRPLGHIHELHSVCLPYERENFLKTEVYLKQIPSSLYCSPTLSNCRRKMASAITNLAPQNYAAHNRVLISSSEPHNDFKRSRIVGMYNYS